MLKNVAWVCLSAKLLSISAKSSFGPKTKKDLQRAYPPPLTANQVLRKNSHKSNTYGLTLELPPPPPPPATAIVPPAMAAAVPKPIPAIVPVDT